MAVHISHAVRFALTKQGIMALRREFFHDHFFDDNDQYCGSLQLECSRLSVPDQAVYLRVDALLTLEDFGLYEHSDGFLPAFHSSRSFRLHSLMIQKLP